MKPEKSDDRRPEVPARDLDLAGAKAAMHRAAKRARRRAAACGHPIAIFRNGKIVREKVDDETAS